MKAVASASVLPFNRVHERERKYLGLHDDLAEPAGSALALSGGGIRSASFALGVAQALVEANLLKRFHYLSTVSGGGYMGTALSWLKHVYGDRFEDQLGSRNKGDRTETGAEKTWLDYVRMHGNYLKPPSIAVLSLIGVALRSLVFTTLVYGGAAVALVALLVCMGVLPSWCVEGCSRRPWYGVERWTALVGCWLALQILLYGLATWLTSIRPTWRVLGSIAVSAVVGYALFRIARDKSSEMVAAWPYVVSLVLTLAGCLWLAIRSLAEWSNWRVLTDRDRNWGATWHYRLRTTLQRALGVTISLMLALLVLWSLPLAYAWLRGLAFWAGAGSTSITAIGAVWKFVSTQRRGAGAGGTDGMLVKLVPVVGAAALIYGGLLVAFALQAGGWKLPFCPVAWQAPPMTCATALIIGGAALLLGLFCNVNYLSLGRMYRDRLMEMFMPGDDAIKQTQWHPATSAETLKVADLYQQNAEGSARLLHLLNCNLIMVDAKRDSFRGRGGDSFYYSALFSGSTATGWVESTVVGGRGMPLATAMATSGAAVSPDAGGAGQGITRNRLVSFIMWFFNIRLGYWLRNPNATWVGKNLLALGPPNFWFPGLWHGLLGRGLSEKAAFVELSDGGHFDNTAVYELIRRRVKVIVLSEAGADPAYRMEDLANAIERVRADFGVHVRFDILGFAADRIRPRGDDPAMKGYAERGFALATIHYPPEVDAHSASEMVHFADWPKGYLVYLQATKVDKVAQRVDIDAYARAHPNFPNETTADQFFDEDQLEAYRELGMEVAQQALEAVTNQSLMQGDESNSPPILAALTQELGIVPT